MTSLMAALEAAGSLAGMAGASDAGGTAAREAAASRSLLQVNSTGNATSDITALAALDEQLTQLCECWP